MHVPNLPSIEPKLLKSAAVISVLSLLVGGLLWFQGRPTPVEIAPVVTEIAQESSSIFVHVVGEVTNSGVYELTTGARVIDAIRAAGGVTKKANVTNLNLARILFDGEQVLITDGSTVSDSETLGGKISINQASAAQLDSLPGIGPVIAGRIVSHREQNGPFPSLEAIMDVSGIGDSLFSKIKDAITL